MPDSRACGLPLEIWRNIFQHTLCASSVDDFMSLNEYQYRYLAGLPWLHRYALPLISVCKEWQTLALPLLYEHVFFRNPDSMGYFEDLIARKNLLRQAAPAAYVRSIYIQLDEGYANNIQMLSILSRLPNLRVLLDLSQAPEGGSFGRICPVITPSLQVLNIEVQDIFSFGLVAKLQNLTELTVAVVMKNELSWVSSDFSYDLTLPHLNYLNVFIWADDDEVPQIRRWLVPYLTHQCLFPALRSARLNLKWDHDSDESHDLRPFFDRHPSLVDVNFPVYTEADMLNLPRSLPVTWLSVADSVLHVEPMRLARALETLPRSVQCLKFNSVDLSVLDEFVRMLPQTSNVQVKDIWIHCINSEPGTRSIRFTWHNMLANEVVAMSSETTVFGTLSSLSMALKCRRPHPIRLLDSDRNELTVCTTQHM